MHGPTSTNLQFLEVTTVQVKVSKGVCLIRSGHSHSKFLQVVQCLLTNRLVCKVVVDADYGGLFARRTWRDFDISC